MFGETEQVLFCRQQIDKIDINTTHVGTFMMSHIQQPWMPNYLLEYID